MTTDDGYLLMTKTSLWPGELKPQEIGSTWLVYTPKYQRLSRACIVHLVINRTNWSYVKTMSCGGGHLGFQIGIKNPNFLEDLQMIIPEQFGFNCPSGFREEAF